MFSMNRTPISKRSRSAVNSWVFSRRRTYVPTLATLARDAFSHKNPNAGARALKMETITPEDLDYYEETLAIDHAFGRIVVPNSCEVVRLDDSSSLFRMSIVNHRCVTPHLREFTLCVSHEAVARFHASVIIQYRRDKVEYRVVKSWGKMFGVKGQMNVPVFGYNPARANSSTIYTQTYTENKGDVLVGTTCRSCTADFWEHRDESTVHVIIKDENCPGTEIECYIKMKQMAPPTTPRKI